MSNSSMRISLLSTGNLLPPYLQRAAGMIASGLGPALDRLTRALSAARWAWAHRGCLCQQAHSAPHSLKSLSCLRDLCLLAFLSLGCPFPLLHLSNPHLAFKNQLIYVSSCPSWFCSHEVNHFSHCYPTAMTPFFLSGHTVQHVRSHSSPTSGGTHAPQWKHGTPTTGPREIPSEAIFIV